jgi:hypothetical protein
VYTLFHAAHAGGSDQLPQIATTQPTTQNKTKQFGWSGIIIGKKTTTPPPPPQHDVITF